MDEYIKRKDVLKELRRYGLENGSSLGYHSGAVECAERAIQALPAANVVPAVTPLGHWIHPVCGDGEVCCSVCKGHAPWFYGYGTYEPAYCPHCGAKMDGGYNE